MKTHNIMRYKPVSLLPLFFACVAFAGDNASTTIHMTQGDTGLISESIAHEAQAALQRGMRWLDDRQEPAGDRSTPDDPAFTAALPLLALLKNPESDQAAVDKAVRVFIQEAQNRKDHEQPWAALLNHLCAGIEKNDPRVQSPFNWIMDHWTLEEVPGLGQDGLYYYYIVLAKALALYGQDILTLADGRQINWRTELVRKLINIQKTDPKTGNGFWGENDPVLATTYSLLALEVALNR